MARRRQHAHRIAPFPTHAVSAGAHVIRTPPNLRILFVTAALAMAGLPTTPALAAPAADASAASPRRALELIREWVKPGWYDNVAQTERDIQNETPDRLVHRPMHQFFAPVKLPQFEGYLVFQQASQDGSRTPESLIRTGLLQYLVDEKLGVVRQRELNFKDAQRFRDAHLDPALLAKATLDDVRFDPACDFLLKVSADGSEVRGPVPARTCWIESRGLGKRLWADDEVVIRRVRVPRPLQGRGGGGEVGQRQRRAQQARVAGSRQELTGGGPGHCAANWRRSSEYCSRSWYWPCQ
jgi:hypothetical protein